MISYYRNILYNNYNPKKFKTFKAFYKRIYKTVLLETQNFKLNSFSEKIFFFCNNLKEIPTCYCGNPLRFDGFIKKRYGKFCSTLCKNKSKENRETAKKLIENCRKVYREKYNELSPFHSLEIRKKIKDTWYKKYGCLPTQHPSIKKKTKETQLKNGTTFKYSSKESSIFFQKLLKSMNIEKYKIYTQSLNTEYFLFSDKNDGAGYFYDFTIVSPFKKIIEYNGDIWHANPKFFKEEDTPNPFDKNLTARDIWEYNKQKINSANQKGFEVLEIWSSDCISDQSLMIKKCLKFLNI